jgi:Transcriptional regulator, AbiEi antitoxin/Protein of unknown function (DUF559)
MSGRDLGDLPVLRYGGVVTAAELHGAGIAREQARSLVRSGSLITVCRGVYAPAAQAGRTDTARHDRLVAATAAALLAGPQAVVSHHDAAIVHEVALLTPPADGTVEITRPRTAARGRRLRPGVRSHTAALPARHVVIEDGIPVTSVERTVVDLARVLPFAAAVVTADSALYRGKTTASRLCWIAGDCAGWPGIKRAIEVIDFSHPQAESPLESISRVAFRDGGLPTPVLQAWIMRGRSAIGRVDFLWQEQRTIAEADGAMKYTDPDRARLQLRRDAELRKAGYEVVHFTWHDITARPGDVIAQILAAFERARRLQGRLATTTAWQD